MTHTLRRLVVAGFALCAVPAMAQAPLTATDARDLSRVIERRIQELAPTVALSGAVTSRIANGAVVITAPASPSAVAAAVEDMFYEGKTIRFQLSAGEGGGGD